MIDLIRAENFKSLRNLDLELGRCNVVVGPNMCGKSNIIDAFRLLASLAAPASGDSALSTAFRNLGGFSEVAWKGSDSGLIAIQIEGSVFGAPAAQPSSPSSFRYAIEVVGDRFDNVNVQSESLVLTHENKEQEVIGKEQGMRALKQRDGRTLSQVYDPSRAALEYSVPDWPGEHVRGAFGSFRFYRLVPAAMKAVTSPSAAAMFLQEHGQNLASWLLTIQTQHSAWFDRIQMAMRDAFPEIESVFTVPTQQSTVFVSSRERYLQRPTTVAQMSDGELAFLALLSLIYAPPDRGAALYCVEEPENHLHPRLVEMLIQLLRQRQEELPAEQQATILISTHSPHVVDQFDLDEIIVVEKRKGATLCTRPREKSHLRELLERKEAGLGDLFYSGALGSG